MGDGDAINRATLYGVHGTILCPFRLFAPATISISGSWVAACLRIWHGCAHNPSAAAAGPPAGRSSATARGGTAASAPSAWVAKPQGRRRGPTRGRQGSSSSWAAGAFGWGSGDATTPRPQCQLQSLWTHHPLPTALRSQVSSPGPYPCQGSRPQRAQAGPSPTVRGRQAANAPRYACGGQASCLAAALPPAAVSRTPA